MSRESADALRKASGTVKSSDPLVTFLYLLMRDHLPTGTVASLMNEVPDQESVFTNGWLAQYAQYVADHLKVDQ